MEDFKKAYRVKLIVMGMFVIGLLLALGSCTFFMFGSNANASILPAIEEELVTEYKEIAMMANLDWAEMIAYDAVRYDNDFSKADPSETGFKFLIVDYKRYELIEECLEEDENGDCISTSTEWEVVEEDVLTTKEAILGKLQINQYVTDITIKEVIEQFNELDAMEEYEIKYSSKDIEEIIDDFTKDQIEWINVLISEGIVYKMFGESINLPGFIGGGGDSLFAWPVPTLHRVTSPYGWRIHPVTGASSFHYGVDISGSDAHGQPVISIEDGYVLQVTHSNTAAGYNIRVKHTDTEGNEWQSRYCHLSEIIVTSGEFVQRGKVIGAVGNTGRSTGPHLHIELKYNGKSVDPYLYIK